MNNFSFVKESANDQSKEDTLLVATYELGKIIQCHHYSKRFGIDRIEKMGYKAYGKTEMADLISMLRMYCEQQEWDYNELLKIGEERYVERMDDLKNNGKKDELKECYR